jgi:glycosyltransferase involved in cell wall biosynthesis
VRTRAQADSPAADVSALESGGDAAGSRTEPLRILHVAVALSPTNTQYHEHCLPALGRRRLVLCSLFRSSIEVAPGVRLVEGDRSVAQAWSALLRSLRSGPFDAVHVHAPASAAVVMLACLLRRTPRQNLVFTLHGTYRHFGWRNRLLLVPVISFYPTLVLCGASVQRELPVALRSARRRSTVVPNGVDTDAVRRLAAVAERRPSPILRIVVVGRLITVKNVACVVRAVAQVEGTTVTVVGDGPVLDELRQLASTLGCADRVSFAGLHQRNGVFALLGASDLLVSASYSEGIPVAVLEAMAAGLPVVLSDIPAHREITSCADFVPLVAPDRDDQLAEQLSRFAVMPDQDRVDIGDRCRRLVEQRFGIEAMTESYGRLYLRKREKAGT